MEERLNLKFPVIVEGRYDKAKLSLVVSSAIFTLDGFSIFNNEEKKQLLKRISKDNGVIILTDSDRAGNFIRSKLKGILNGKIYNVYAPEIYGKERRKVKPSADGLLGVEGIAASSLRELLLPFSGEGEVSGAGITKARFYEDGFSGTAKSSDKRESLAELLSLPKTLSSKAMLEAINLVVSYDDYEKAVSRIKESYENC